MKLRKDAIDITNKRFGKLIALHPMDHVKHRGVVWFCQCDCGKTTKAPGGHLRAGMRVSCGCKSGEKAHESAINFLMSSYKSKARKRGKEFILSRVEFENLVLGNCFYCDKDPKQILKKQKSNKIAVLYNGIDRMDSDKGYSSENCVSCCMYCNRMKSNLSKQEFLDHIERIYKWHLIDF